MKSTHADLSSTHDKLKDEHDTASKSLKESQGSLKGTSSDLDKAKKDLAATTKRAEAAEKKRDALQSDNTDLVAQLEEVRGKVVKTSDEKAELVTQVQSWESKNKVWEKTKEELETELSAAKVRIHTLCVTCSHSD